MRRLGIFLFYDGKGQVSDHVKRSLRAFRPHMDDLLFVANGAYDAQSFPEAAELTTDILVRENVGFDVWGYKEGLEHIGFGRLADYDEVVLFNYTFFAPLHDVGAMFATMAERDLDFWGMTEYRDAAKSFLQSYFLVSRRSLHATGPFRQYWETMPMISSINDSLEFHEFRFTRHFAEAGFRHAPYIANEDSWTGNTTLVDLPALHAKGMPVIKYRAFNFPESILERRGGYSAAENFRFVAEETDYPVAEIWDYIIAQTPAAALTMNAELFHVLPEAPAPRAVPQAARVLVTLRDPEQVDLALQYLKAVPAANLFVATSCAEIEDRLKAAGHAVRPLTGAETALDVWGDVLPAAGGPVLLLSDFDGERGRYHFIAHLFAVYWSPLIGPEGIPGSLLDYLEANPHLGMAYPLPHSVDGREGFTKPVTQGNQGRKAERLPAHLAPSYGSHLWPWRGIAILRGAVAADARFRADLALVGAGRLYHRDDRIAGGEAFLPEMVRATGHASAVIARTADLSRIALRSLLIEEQWNTRFAQRAQKFRADLALAQASAAGRHDANDRGWSLGDCEIKLAITSDTEIELTLIPPGEEARVFAATPFAKVGIDQKTIADNRVQLRGWCFDADVPAQPLAVAIFADATLISDFVPVDGQRPDVASAFAGSGVSDDSGFRVDSDGALSIDTDTVTYRVAILSADGDKAMLIPISRPPAPPQPQDAPAQPA